MSNFHQKVQIGQHALAHRWYQKSSKERSSDERVRTPNGARMVTLSRGAESRTLETQCKNSAAHPDS